MTLTREQYVKACLDKCGYPFERNNTITLHTRIVQEWGHESGSGPRFNALDLTEYEHGATPFNSFGIGGRYHVWNYPSLEEGAQAFHDILQAGQYWRVRFALKHNWPPLRTINAWNRTNWGYCNPAIIPMVENNFAEYAYLLVAE